MFIAAQYFMVHLPLVMDYKKGLAKYNAILPTF